jgi:CRISPR-associated protein Csd1
MLHRVSEYVEKNQIPHRVGCAFLDAKFVIGCNPEGRFEGVFENEDRDRFCCAPFLEQPDMVSGGKNEKKSQFLLDNAASVTLLDENGTTPRHGYFWKLIAEASEHIPQLSPLLELSKPEVLDRIRRELKERKAKPTDNVTFSIGGEYPVDCDYWHSWWDGKIKDIRSQAKRTKKGREQEIPMLSLSSGEPVDPCLTHPKIKRLPESQPSGASLIGFDKPSFRSFELDQSRNCAMSEAEAAKYAAGLNYLIRKQSRDLAGAKVLFWYKEPVPVEDDPLAAIVDLAPDDPSTEAAALNRLRDLLEAIRSGQRPDLAGNEFYVLTMAGNRGRAVVRDWQEGSYERLVEAVTAWLDDIAIILPSGNLSQKQPGIQRLIECVLPPLKKGQKRDEWLKRAQQIRSTLWRAAIGNRQAPFEVVALLVPELRDFALTGDLESCFYIQKKEKQKGRKKDADGNSRFWLLWQRMALLKAYHLRKGHGPNRSTAQERIDPMAIQPCLNPGHPSPAYQCGRLMAVLANVQREALGSVGAGVIQRYYAAASATPGLVFGRLIRNTQYHVDKVRSTKGGLARFFDDTLAEICCRIGDEIPATLSLEDQSLFALGFYQQMARPRSKGTSGDADGVDAAPAQTNSEENAL